jgi:two-component system, LytTR family, response regulator
LLWCLYACVFLLTSGVSLGHAMLDSAANVAPLALLALMTHSLLKEHVLPKPVWAQAGLHIILATAFATLWYSAVLLCLAVIGKLRSGVFTINAFEPAAFTWQVFQGLVLYALVAAICYAIRGGRQAATIALIDQPNERPPLDRYLSRTGDDICPVETRDIVTITGAQDYSEVATVARSTHLVRMSLGEFEARLDAARFLRVHRSIIINFDHLDRAEPAGNGRLLVHMRTGAMVQTSRAGAQMLRQLIV